MECHTLMSGKHTYPQPNVCMRTGAYKVLFHLPGSCVLAPQPQLYKETPLKPAGFLITSEEFS